MEYEVLEDGTVKETGEAPVRLINSEEVDVEIKQCQDYIANYTSEIARLQAKIAALTPVKVQVKAIVDAKVVKDLDRR